MNRVSRIILAVAVLATIVAGINPSAQAALCVSGGQGVREREFQTFEDWGDFMLVCNVRTVTDKSNCQVMSREEDCYFSDIYYYD